MRPCDFFLNKEFMKNAVIEDHELKGITPEMVDWWWGHIDNSERYKLWHPKDHVSFRWLVPPTPQSYIGAIQLVEEYIGGQLVTVQIRWEDPTDVPAEYGHVLVASILDDKGEILRSFKHEYKKAPKGVRMRSTFPLTPETPKWRAQGLPAHNREEMQRLPEFLPKLYREEALSRRG
jgi:hypothetical protein